MRRPVNYRLDPRTVTLIAEMARKLGISRTAVIERAVAKWVLDLTLDEAGKD